MVAAAVSLAWQPLESAAVRSLLWNVPWIVGAALGLAMLSVVIEQADRGRQER